jgi:NAD(P)H-nitrite reductase large subunit
MQKTYIVIGASAAGLAAVQKIRQFDADARILCFSEESEFPYNKCFLADFLSRHKDLSAVYTKSLEFLKSLSIELHLATKVIAIDRQAKTIECSDGKTYNYTVLLLAVGAASRTPTCVYPKGVKGFFPFYTLQDALSVDEWIQKEKPKKVAVVGAGLTGLEVADALRMQGLQVTIVEQQERLLMRHVDDEGAAFISAAVERSGIDLVLGKGVKEIVADDTHSVSEIIFTDGTRKKVEMVVGALGSCARLELAESAGLTIEQGAVVTNDYLQTNDPAIFAAGDVALVKNRITGEKVRTALWPDAVAQGMYAGTAMAFSNIQQETVILGEEIRLYPGVIPLATSSFATISFHSAGFLESHFPGWTEKIERTQTGYAKVIRDDQGVVKGFICTGDLVSHMVAYKRALVSGTLLSQELK